MLLAVNLYYFFKLYVYLYDPLYSVRALNLNNVHLSKAFLDHKSFLLKGKNMHFTPIGNDIIQLIPSKTADSIVPYQVNIFLIDGSSKTTSLMQPKLS